MGILNLPPGFSIDLSQLTLTSSKNDAADWLYVGDQLSWVGTTSEEEKKKRIDAGECIICGKKREMSRFGLLDCPDHPTPSGPQ